MEPELLSYLSNAAIQLEKRRKGLTFLNTFYRFLVKPIAYLVGAATVVLFGIGIFLPPFLIWAFVGLVGYFLLKSVPDPATVYLHHIKDKILPEIFEHLDSNYTYDPYGLNSDVLKESGIFNKSFFKNHSYIHGEDLVSGMIDQVAVHFNEIKFYRKDINFVKTFFSFLATIVLIPIAIIAQIISQFSGGGADSSDIDIPFFEVIRDEVRFYKGLFMFADFHKEFEGEVVLMPKKLAAKSDQFSSHLINAPKNEIQIEDVELQKMYRIISTNSQLAYYVLSPSLLKALLEIITIEKIAPILVFKHGKMYMTFPWDKDYFSVDLKDKVNGAEYFTRYINEIKSFEQIIKHFSLDKRIWSKS